MKCLDSLIYIGFPNWFTVPAKERRDSSLYANLIQELLLVDSLGLEVVGNEEFEELAGTDEEDYTSATAHVICVTFLITIS